MKWISSTPTKVAAWTLACLPFAWSAVIHSGATPAPMSIAVPERPSLSFRQYAVDLGAIHPTTEARGTFVFLNSGTKDVEITNISPSCSCLVPQLPQKRFGPGESGKIILRVQPANEPSGKKELYADVSYNDPQPRNVRLTFKLEIPERQLTVSPPSLMVYHPEGSEPTLRTFVVADGRKKPFEITDVVATSDLVTADIGERHVSPSGVWQQEVHVTIQGKLPAGKSHVVLRVHTSDADTPELRVPLMLQGPQAAGDSTSEVHDHDHTTPKRVEVKAPVNEEPSNASTDQ